MIYLVLDLIEALAIAAGAWACWHLLVHATGARR